MPSHQCSHHPLVQDVSIVLFGRVHVALRAGTATVGGSSNLGVSSILGVPLRWRTHLAARRIKVTTNNVRQMYNSHMIPVSFSTRIKTDCRIAEHGLSSTDVRFAHPATIRVLQSAARVQVRPPLKIDAPFAPDRHGCPGRFRSPPGTGNGAKASPSPTLHPRRTFPRPTLPSSCPLLPTSRRHRRVQNVAPNVAPL